MNEVKTIKQESVENAFEYLINAIEQENIEPSRELAIVMTKIQEAQLWFSKVDTLA